MIAGHVIRTQHPRAQGKLHRLARQISELVVSIEVLYALVGPGVVEKRVHADAVDDCQRQAQAEMVLEIMEWAKRQEASPKRDDGPRRTVHLSFGMSM